MIQQLVIASNNLKKREEIEHILSSLNINVLPAEQTRFVEVVEDGKTFAENAQKKAEAFMLANQLPALADDSGLCVVALNGAPGVYSARFAGEEASDTENNEQLLSELGDIKPRKASFHCALHLAIPNKSPVVAEAKVDGFILDHLLGDVGFGYDPLFFSPKLNKTFAQATPEEKASISHRGRALRLLKNELEKPFVRFK